MKIDFNSDKNEFQVGDQVEVVGYDATVTLPKHAIYEVKTAKVNDCGDMLIEYGDEPESLVHFTQCRLIERPEKPKEKKRYWMWSVVNSNQGLWVKRTEYIDDDGLYTDGGYCAGWSLLEKIKHEDEFIEV